MEITLEWEGISGIIKLILIFLITLSIGFIIGRKTKWKNYYYYNLKPMKKLLLISLNVGN